MDFRTMLAEERQRVLRADPTEGATTLTPTLSSRRPLWLKHAPAKAAAPSNATIATSSAGEEEPCTVAADESVLCTLSVGNGQTLKLQQHCSDAQEGAVVWDCARSLLGHLQQQGPAHAAVAGKRVLELGSGTGAVGLALARMGAASVVLTDLPAALPLLRTNAKHNCAAEGCELTVEPLGWGAWRSCAAPHLLRPRQYDWLVASDVLYGTTSAVPFAELVLELFSLNPTAMLLLAYERRPDANGLTPRADEFFAELRGQCAVERVPHGELDPALACDDITIFRVRLCRSGTEPGVPSL